MDKKYRMNALYVFFAIWGVILVQRMWVAQTQVSEIPYSEFLSQLQKGNVEEVIVADSHLQGKLKSPIDGKTNFITIRMEPELAAELEKSGVRFSARIESTFLRDLLSWIVPTALFFLVWIFIARRFQSGMQGGILSLGKNKAKVYVEQDTKTAFSDIAGVEEAKEELKEVVGFLKDPQGYGRLGARTPKGVLLVGPHGTGKTLLARAVAGEAKVPFFSINGSEFVEMFVGLGAARVRDLFQEARSKAPCILFIDELDALGKSRSNPMASGHDEKEQTLNQLLVEMDGFDARSGIVILAATNRPEILDPALLRAGRFDRQVLVDRPDRVGRLAILKIHSKTLTLDPAVNLEQVADLTAGFSGADLANLCNEAAIIATRQKKNSVTQSDFTAAFERIVAGLERKTRLLSEKEKHIVAHHEMGHALVAASLPGSDPVHKISVIPRGIGALGYTLQRPSGDRFLMTEQELRNRMCVLLGGRASEMLIFSHFSTGAADDLVKVTDIARNMVARYGMNRTLGSSSLDSDTGSFLTAESFFMAGQRKYSDETARQIDEAIRDLVDEELERALRILNLNREILLKGAQMLMEQETLEQDVLQELFAKISITGAERTSDHLGQPEHHA